MPHKPRPLQLPPKVGCSASQSRSSARYEIAISQMPLPTTTASTAAAATAVTATHLTAGHHRLRAYRPPNTRSSIPRSKDGSGSARTSAIVQPQNRSASLCCRRASCTITRRSAYVYLFDLVACVCILLTHSLTWIACWQDLIPSGVIPLEYYVVNIKYLERKFSFLLKLAFDGFKDMTTQYKLQAESRDLLDTWFEKIKRQVRTIAHSCSRARSSLSFSFSPSRTNER